MFRHSHTDPQHVLELSVADFSDRLDGRLRGRGADWIPPPAEHGTMMQSARLNLPGMQNRYVAAPEADRYGRPLLVREDHRTQSNRTQSKVSSGVRPGGAACKDQKRSGR